MNRRLQKFVKFLLRRETAWGVASVLLVALLGMLAWVASTGGNRQEVGEVIRYTSEPHVAPQDGHGVGHVRGKKEMRIASGKQGDVAPAEKKAEAGNGRPDLDGETDKLFASVITDLEKSLREVLDAKDPVQVRRLMKMLAGLVGDRRYGALARVAFVNARSRLRGIDWSSSGGKTAGGSYAGGDGLIDYVDGLAAEAGIVTPDLSTELMMQLDGWASDAERGEVVRRYSTQVTDETLADQLAWEVDANKMRNSEAIRTLTHMIENGTDVVRQKALEAAERFTGLEEVASSDQLQEWLKENPDSEGDAKRYARKKTFMEYTSFDDK